MSRRVYGRALEQVAPVGEPFSRHDGHRVGSGRKAAKTLTAAVREAEAARDDARAARDDARAALEECVGRHRVRLAEARRCVCVCRWMAGVCAVMVVLLVVLWAVLALRL